MNDIELVDGFIELFQGNKSAIGTEEGGCVRIQPEDWALYVEAHLRGTDVNVGSPGPRGPIGVYPMVFRQHGGWGVHWGCIDFDEGEEASLVHAFNARSALSTLGVTSWIERSRSKGFHVWVFSEDFLPARTMRAALLAVCQLVGAPTKEVNPKSETLQEGQVGNYVRLPYPGAFAGGKVADGIGKDARRVVLFDDGTPYRLHEFVEEALAASASESTLKEVAALFRVTRRPFAKHEPVAGTSTEPIKRLSGLAYTILTEGPKPGVDRSTTLWKLATRIHDDGRHTFEEALDILVQGDIAWGKFMERPDGERYLREMLEKVWDD